MAIRRLSGQVVEMEHENRLQLKPYRSVSEHIDGAWWPRSQHLVDELPNLMASVSDRLGQVVMVGYRRNGWTETPALAEIAGHTIELFGFASNEPTSVILIGEDGRHITLHVIRPDASERLPDKRSRRRRERRRQQRSGQPSNGCEISKRCRRKAGPPRGARRRASNRSDQAVV